MSGLTSDDALTGGDGNDSLFADDATEGDATVLLDGVAVSVVQGVGTGFTAANVQLDPRAAATP
ncbi:hypothetical protein KPG71_00165 [Roseovarius sp. PS-C2]|nr:hypothetical protein [Roseovarius sp. PS-C2]